MKNTLHDYANNHQLEYMENQLADPDYYADMRDPARAARGIFWGIVLSIPFWGIIIALVWMANVLIGGG